MVKKLVEGTNPMFPEHDYTPYGYLDNPFHTWKSNRSGVFRVSPPVGFEWLFPNALKPFLKSSINIGLQINDQVLFSQVDWHEQAVPLNSPYHSKNLFTFSWNWHGFSLYCEFFIADEKGLAVKLRVQNSNSIKSKLNVLLQHSVQLTYRQTNLWDFGLTGTVKPDLKTSVLKSFAEGYCFTHNFSEPCNNYIITDETENVDPASVSTKPKKKFFSTTKENIKSLVKIPVEFSEEDEWRMDCVLTRGVSENETMRLARELNPRLEGLRNEKLEEDAAFWEHCPQLSGDWPAHWQRGWVYDWETQRMNLRMPVGIFTTEWDAMQIQMPRIVLAETALDMLMMSYADPKRSQQVILGLFKDALGPHVPCAREDGSLNMISEDGSECGTSPAWCWPFFCFQSIFGRTGDRDWLESLYPYLENYLDWWLNNRTDEQGWAVYNCSWESGQDDSIKFLIDQPTGGEIVDHLRAVDLQAAMAQSAAVLNDFSKILGKSAHKWKQLQKQFEDKTQAMWQHDWFCDFDRRSESWVYKDEYRDITNLSPFFCGIFSEDQVSTIEHWFRHFKRNRKYWLEWASFFFMYLEACWRTGFKKLAAEVLFETADRVYRNWDRRDWQQGEAMPGISIECWGYDKPYGSEGYGWGATMPIHIIRSLIGFREEITADGSTFSLCPNLPKEFCLPGKKYTINKLKFQENQFSLTYEIESGPRLMCQFELESQEAQAVSVATESGEAIFQSSEKAHQHNGSLILKNREKIYFKFTN